MKKLFTLLLLVTATLAVYAQKEVSGVVEDEQGQPVIGASVIAKGTTIGTATDIDGQFKMDVPATSPRPPRNRAPHSRRRPRSPAAVSPAPAWSAFTGSASG